MYMDYDIQGNLLPPGQIEINDVEFRLSFVDAYPKSVNRPMIYQGYLQYKSTIENTVTVDFEQWINGSWVSNKPNPNDIDLVILVGLPDVKPDIFVHNQLLNKYGSKDKYHVDAYLIIVCPEDDPRYDVLTKKTMEYWDKWWSHDRNNNEKGYIVLKTQFQGVKNV